LNYIRQGKTTPFPAKDVILIIILDWVDKSVKFIAAAFNGKPQPAVTKGVGLRNDGKFGNTATGTR
jgi:hypothetical protein